jgi:hypothetical protein
VHWATITVQVCRNRRGVVQMLARKPKMLVTVALANKMARIVWALLVKGGTYRTPAVAAYADHDREDVRASGRRVWRNSRRDEAGTTRGFHCASSTLWVIWTRSANSHKGRRLSSCRIQGRTDDSIRPRAATIPTFSLAWRGASTDGNRSFAATHQSVGAAS